MKSLRLGLVVMAACLASSLSPAWAASKGKPFLTTLNGYNEVPPVFTTGTGTLNLRINSDSISYVLSFSGLSSNVTQAHIHFGERPVNGGIIVYLCDNTGKAPSGVPACPNSGTVTSTIITTDVDPSGDPEPTDAQGIISGDFAGLIGAIVNGDAYANVHTDNFPSGEIRGWLQPPSASK